MSGILLCFVAAGGLGNAGVFWKCRSKPLGPRLVGMKFVLRKSGIVMNPT